FSQEAKSVRAVLIWEELVSVKETDFDLSPSRNRIVTEDEAEAAVVAVAVGVPQYAAMSVSYEKSRFHLSPFVASSNSASVMLARASRRVLAGATFDAPARDLLFSMPFAMTSSFSLAA